MTPQEIFDTVAVALVKQGRPSIKAKRTWSHSCAYRGDDGAKCAVGHLIPDEHYTPEIEGSGVSCPYMQPVLEALGLSAHRPLLSAMQGAHDATANMCVDDKVWLVEWAKDMRQVAQQHNLSTAALDAALLEAGASA